MNFDISQAVVLKPEREKHIKNKHPWVFMGAIAHYNNAGFENGDVLPVVAATDQFVGYGYFHKGQSISGRMVSFVDEDPLETIRQNITNAAELRKHVVPPDTTAYRLVNGEGDNLPGLIIDVYGQIAVMQINTLGMEKLKSLITRTLLDVVELKAIYEKSNTATRKKEGLPEADGWVHGEGGNSVIVQEHGLQFKVAFSGTQKTGFFLDQREMRNLVKFYARGKSVLNCFSYTGGFSVYALAGGASRVDSVDISEAAIIGAKENVTLNGFSENNNGFFAQDVPSFLRNSKTAYDFIILDPPAYAKRASDIKNASRGYRDLNRMAMQKLSSAGLLLTSSCSSHIDRAQFQTIIFQAAKDAKRSVKILSYHVMAADHPINLYYPEGDYLKSLLLHLE